MMADTQLPDRAPVIAKVCKNLTDQPLRQKPFCSYLKWVFLVIHFNYLPFHNDWVYKSVVYLEASTKKITEKQQRITLYLKIQYGTNGYISFKTTISNFFPKRV